jgi:hypothetical protein
MNSTVHKPLSAITTTADHIQNKDTVTPKLAEPISVNNNAVSSSPTHTYQPQSMSSASSFDYDTLSVDGGVSTSRSPSQSQVSARNNYLRLSKIIITIRREAISLAAQTTRIQCELRRLLDRLDEIEALLGAGRFPGMDGNDEEEGLGQNERLNDGGNTTTIATITTATTDNEKDKNKKKEINKNTLIQDC